MTDLSILNFLVVTHKSFTHHFYLCFPLSLALLKRKLEESFDSKQLVPPRLMCYFRRITDLLHRSGLNWRLRLGQSGSEYEQKTPLSPCGGFITMAQLRHF